MGSCVAKEDDQFEFEEETKDKDSKIGNSLRVDKIDEDRVVKILLLGAGQSGKSTLFKQMTQHYADPYSKGELEDFSNIIHCNVVESMKLMLEWSDLLADEGYNTKISPEHEEYRDKIMDLHELKTVVNGPLSQIIKALWKDKGIRETWKNRNRFPLSDSADYFFQDEVLDRIGKEPYIPIKEDILRARTRTTGLSEKEFEYENVMFKVLDVGGQRNERKKWIHCFENVTAVIFVAAISEYDQTLYEDEGTSCIRESLNLFEDISNCYWFKNTNLILFLNKKDLLMKKVKLISLSNYFHDFDGEDYNFDDAVQFFTNQFLSRNKCQRKVYVHVTNATDPDNFAKTFQNVKEIITNMVISEAGF